jgi:hypothetical protein
MKKQRVEKRKSPVITTVRTNETVIDFSYISFGSTGAIKKGGIGDFKIQTKLYWVPGTVKRERRSAGGGGDI